MIALIDGDILVYECGFSSDSSAKAKGIEHEPLAFAIQNVKNRIKDIMDVTEADGYEIYLTGKNNFRLDILPEYKANRDPNHRPFWYKELKTYLIDEQEAVVADGIEADDMLGIRQMDERTQTVICSKDKDLDCIPGLHYNWSPTRWENGVYDISEIEALRFFYTQIFTGDSTDNIPGLKKLVGKIATKKIKGRLDEFDNEVDMFQYVSSVFGGDDFIPSAKCLWILRQHNGFWEPPVIEETKEAEKEEGLDVSEEEE